MEMFFSPDFWLAVGQIILIDILLGGDNAVVIALACRSLPPEQRRKGILWGTAGAIVLRVILIFFALTLLKIPFIKLAGAILLVWIGIKLLMPEHGGGGHGNVAASDKLWGAVRTVIVADFVMSLDNVIAIAGAAETAGGDNTMPLVIFGLVVSIPIIVWGSQLVIRLMDRYPIVITLGGMLLGWIAGTMAVSDPALAGWLPADAATQGKAEPLAVLRYGSGIAGALLVLLLGRWFAARARLAGRPAGGVAPKAATARAEIRSLLVAVDGSPGSRKALQRALDLREELRAGEVVALHLLNVQRPLPADVTRFIAGKSVEDYHRERSDAALAPAREACAEAGVVPVEHRRVGEPGATIAEVARTLGCELVVLGARGLGSRAAVLLGSVAHSAIERAGVPVLVVK